ncbi:MAG: DUF938 domain-containing protein [Rhodospirillaceae bacterium]
MNMDSDQISRQVSTTVSNLKQFASPAALRNALPLAEVLRPILPHTGVILEIGSGSGFHAAVMAASFPNLRWQPTEVDPKQVRALQPTAQIEELSNLLPPFALDVTALEWPLKHAQGVLCLNMVHITPWRATEGLLRGVSAILECRGCLYLYGPFKNDGHHTSPSNKVFDQYLRDRNPAWGVRDAREVDDLAFSWGLSCDKVIEMPANNVVRVYRKAA